MTCSIILGAGRSERMGCSKLLLPFADSTVIGCVVDAFLRASVDQVMVVVKPEDGGIRDALAGRSVVFVENPDPHGDMLSSVRFGLRALPKDAGGILVSPGDQPSLSSEVILEMLTAFRSTGSGIMVPVYQGRRGHPLVFDARFRQEILTSYDGVGLRGLLDAHPEQVSEWLTPDPAVLQDLDTPKEYQEALEALRRH